MMYICLNSEMPYYLVSTFIDIEIPFVILGKFEIRQQLIFIRKKNKSLLKWKKIS